MGLTAYDLPRNTAKEKDPNLAQFLATFADTLTADEVDDGLGVQIEVDALEPPGPRQMFADAVEQYRDGRCLPGRHWPTRSATLGKLDGIIDGLD